MKKENENILMVALKALYAPQIDIYQGIASLMSRSPEEKEARAFQNQIQRDEAKAELAQVMAKVQQELAISSRIATADEVEIEEYYEGSGKGNLGALADEKGINLGVAGEGKRVIKRVLRFKGWRPAAELQSEIVETQEKNKNAENE